MVMMKWLSLFILFPVNVLSTKQERHDDILKTHFNNAISENLADNVASTQLPPNVLKGLFHIDSSLFGDDEKIFYGSILDNTFSNENTDKDKSLYMLCGPQPQAKLARSEIFKYFQGRLSIIHASRITDTACWRASLSNDNAEKLRSSPAFFHVIQIPNIAKFAPNLLSIRLDDQVSPASQVLGKGLRIQFEENMDADIRSKLFTRWNNDGFGLLSSEHLNTFPPLLNNDDNGPWKGVREAMNGGQCSSLLRGLIPKDAEESKSSILHLSFNIMTVDNNEEGSSIIDNCVLASLAYLVSQNEVLGIEAIPNFKLHTIGERKTMEEEKTITSDVTSDLKTKGKVPVESLLSTGMDTLSNDDGAVGGIGTMNTVATTALQSGSESNPNPFWSLGINGTGQYVQVTDTGFDDASCFLRQADSASVLTGSFNSDVQVARTAYTVATTDFTRRKVVQYIMRSTSTASYGYDYASGHGSHCAGTVLGFVPNDGSTIGTNEDYYSNCASYVAYCDSWFSSTGSDPGTCDTTCGFGPTGDAYSGMAPNAKLFAYDFGDASGNLDVPTDMATEVYGSAYDEGARVTSNSWGSSAPYDTYDSQALNVDQFIYDEDDVLVVFAAGNANTEGDDDTYGSGDASLGAPAICKNVLTVGAAETAYTPDTLADFSSRGPTPDWRLKPEVSAPGDPIFSISASGSAGLASCEATSKSGTSMATPAVAGIGALIRQILVDGHHETFSAVGFAGSSYSASAPSGALLKALLIGSTVPLTYGYDSSGTEVTLADFYGASTAVADSTAYALGTDGVDFSQGFGHVRLSNIFSLDASFDTYCFEDSLAEYKTWTQYFVVTDTTSEIAITLVWSDPPGSVGCGYDYYNGASTDTCLVHDLDLKVYNDGTRLYSNFGAGDGDYANQEDTFNNAEKTTIATSSLTVGSTITVTVETNGLSYADTQKFAVVVKGNLTTISPAPSLPPSPVPTMAPTAGDTITIISSFDLTSSAAPTTSDETNLRQTIADELNVTFTDVKNFDLTSVSSRRIRRKLLAYTWTVNFDVTVSLATTSSTSSDAYSTFVATVLASTSFTSAVSTSTGATVDTATIATAVATRSPTSLPTLPPTHGDDDDDDDDTSALSVGAVVGIVIGVLLVVGIGIGILVWFLMKQKKEASDAKIEMK